MISLIGSSVGIVLAITTVAWLISLLKKDMGVADVFWGVIFVGIVVGLYVRAGVPSFAQQVASLLVIIWGVRLTLHIGRRQMGSPEDWRYKSLRTKWQRWFHLRSYLQAFVLQSLLAVVISLPLIVIATYAADDPLHWWQWVGIFIWCFGFLFESIGDWQLARFLKTPHQKNTILRRGLWKYTRHPNYFGEVTQWWGIWVISVGYPYSWVAIVGPFTITYLILFVSGVPLLEKRYASNRSYQHYSAVTSKFIPWFPGKEGA